MADLKALIDAQNEKYYACFKANDMKGVAALYTEDCKIMVTGMDTVHGREGVEKVVSNYRVAYGVMTLELKSEEVGPVGGDVTYDRGTYTAKTKDGTVADTGKYVVVWKKVGEDWLLYIDIFNTNKA
ncbi:Hypp7417 [Branchiostoma lanceolatum]|uniref:Hypp7417 protein n=1 Tax=Branchiostoma lanceolatum TaxID=7740 RepID=A0A8K0EDY9_BRALA|nr:Hypp7417 [Branchiostoma lanceolatum]